MERIKIMNEDYNKVELKCGGCVYIEPFDDHEEEERCKIYDENMNYLDYIFVFEPNAHVDYLKEIEQIENTTDLNKYIETMCDRYSTGNSLEDLFYTIMDDYYWDFTTEEMEENKERFFNCLEQNGEQHCCAEYSINKIGNVYFCMED